jgi:arsenite methyltransferase
MLLSYPRALQAASARLQRKQLGRQVNPIDLNRGQSCNALNAPASYQIYGIKSAGEAPEARPALLRWWDAYPSVISAPTPISSDKVADFLRDPTKTGSDYAVIDVRRNDHAVRPMFRYNLPVFCSEGGIKNIQGGHIRGSYQWPAQTFYDDLPGFFEKFGNTEQVIFYCGSSSGRGPRCAGWYVGVYAR